MDYNTEGNKLDASVIRHHTEAVAESADDAAYVMAQAALKRCNNSFHRELETGAQLWIKQNCDPAALDVLGKTSGALIKTGQIKAAIEMGIYIPVFSIALGLGFLLIAAPVFVYILILPISLTIALFLSLSSDR